MTREDAIDDQEGEPPTNGKDKLLRQVPPPPVKSRPGSTAGQWDILFRLALGPFTLVDFESEVLI